MIVCFPGCDTEVVEVLSDSGSGVVWRLEDSKRGIVGEHERETDSDCVEDSDLSE